MGMTMKGFKVVEHIVEFLIWNSRRAMFLAVIACMCAYFAVLLMTVIDLLQIVLPVFKRYMTLDPSPDHQVLH